MHIKFVLFGAGMMNTIHHALTRLLTILKTIVMIRMRLVTGHMITKIFFMMACMTLEYQILLVVPIVLDTVNG